MKYVIILALAHKAENYFLKRVAIYSQLPLAKDIDMASDQNSHFDDSWLVIVDCVKYSYLNGFWLVTVDCKV